MKRAAAAFALFACLAAAQVHAQRAPSVPLSVEPAGTNTLIVIKAADLGSQTVALEINGRKVADLKSSESYKAVYSPGIMTFAAAGETPQPIPVHLEGDRFFLPITAYAITNEEQTYELRLMQIKGSGPVRPVLMLKARKTLDAAYIVPEKKSEERPVSTLLTAQHQVLSRRTDAGAWRELGRHYLTAGETLKARV